MSVIVSAPYPSEGGNIILTPFLGWFPLVKIALPEHNCREIPAMMLFK